MLSFYRLAAAPVAAWVALEGQRDAFFIIVMISIATDLIDGPIARALGQASSQGAKLDTVADACTVLAGIMGLWLFEGEHVRPDIAWLFLFLATYAVAAITSLAKFGCLPAYHLHLSKAAAFSAAMVFVWLYVEGYSSALVLGVAGLGMLANVESLLVTLLLKGFRSDVRSLVSLHREPDEPD